MRILEDPEHSPFKKAMSDSFQVKQLLRTNYKGRMRDGSWRYRLRYATIAAATVSKSFTLSRCMSLILDFKPST